MIGENVVLALVGGTMLLMSPIESVSYLMHIGGGVALVVGSAGVAHTQSRIRASKRLSRLAMHGVGVALALEVYATVLAVSFTGTADWLLAAALGLAALARAARAYRVLSALLVVAAVATWFRQPHALFVDSGVLVGVVLGTATLLIVLARCWWYCFARKETYRELKNDDCEMTEQ